MLRLSRGVLRAATTRPLPAASAALERPRRSESVRRRRLRRVPGHGRGGSARQQQQQHLSAAGSPRPRPASLCSARSPGRASSQTQSSLRASSRSFASPTQQPPAASLQLLRHTVAPPPGPALTLAERRVIEDVYKAAGIVAYAWVRGCTRFLFQLQLDNSRGRHVYVTDFGGKREVCDVDSAGTAAREFIEELTQSHHVASSSSLLRGATSSATAPTASASSVSTTSATLSGAALRNRSAAAARHHSPEQRAGRGVYSAHRRHVHRHVVTREMESLAQQLRQHSAPFYVDPCKYVFYFSEVGTGGLLHPDSWWLWVSADELLRRIGDKSFLNRRLRFSGSDDSFLRRTIEEIVSRMETVYGERDAASASAVAAPPATAAAPAAARRSAAVQGSGTRAHPAVSSSVADAAMPRGTSTAERVPPAATAWTPGGSDGATAWTGQQRRRRSRRQR